MTLSHLVLAAIVFRAFALAAPQLPPANQTAPARVTDRARPDFGFFPWAGRELTVIVVLGPDCKPCYDSVPFYKRLEPLPQIDRQEGRVAFLTVGGIWPAIDMVEKHPDGFRMRRSVSYPADNRFGVTTLPSVLVIDGKWKRRGTWTGRLSPAQEQEVLALLSQIAAEARKSSGR